MITIKNISYKTNQQTILDNINLTLDSQQIIALIGPNGAGKSTLFSLMSRLQPLQTGSIHFSQYDVSQTSTQELAKVVSILAQDNDIQGQLRVDELLMFGRYPYHLGNPTQNDVKKVAEVMSRFELQPLAKRFLSTLSGGQRQRVLIAMVVCQDTPFILLDEPLNNLDMYHAGQLMRMLRSLSKHHQKTIVIVLHDINQASQFADTVVMMKEGKIHQVGHPSDVLTQENIHQLFNIKVTVLSHQGRPVIVDTL